MRPCALGAVKTNLGHLEAAAGIAGFIKAVLAVQRGQIPPNLHFSRWNPAIDASSTRLFVPTELSTVAGRGGGPRRAGVSSFGFGGTNAHVVLEQGAGSGAGGVGTGSGGDHVGGVGQDGRAGGVVGGGVGRLDGRCRGAGVALADVAHTLNHHRARHAQFATVCAR